MADFKKIKNISTDLYYRTVSLPLLVRLWIIILWWGYRIGQQRYKFMETRAELDHIWRSSEQLQGKKLEKREKELKKIEKNFLVIEKDLKDYEEEYFVKKEFLDRFWQKMVDPHLGQDE